MLVQYQVLAFVGSMGLLVISCNDDLTGWRFVGSMGLLVISCNDDLTGWRK